MMEDNLTISEDGTILDEKEPSAAELGMFLTAKQHAWAEGYLQHYDAQRAVMDAYDVAVGSRDNKSVYKIVNDLRHNKKVQRYVTARAAEKALPANAVVAEISDIAMGNLGDFLDDDYLATSGKPIWDLKKAKELGLLKLIKRIRYYKDGGMEIELYPKLEALKLLGQLHGLFNEDQLKVDNYIIQVIRE